MYTILTKIESSTAELQLLLLLLLLSGEVTVSIIRHLGTNVHPLLFGQTGFTAALASYPAVAHVPSFQAALGWLVAQSEKHNKFLEVHTLLRHLCHI